MATRTFLRGLGASAAYSARDSHAGVEPMPTIAMAELFRKIRRFILRTPLASLKVGRSDHQPGHQSRRGCAWVLFLLVEQRPRDRIPGLLGRIGEQNLARGFHGI